MLTGYSCRKIITIDHTLVDEVLTNFTHTVVLTAANFPFYAARPDGFDIRFTSADGDTLLYFERVSHDAAAQTAEYHVLVPAVSADANTIVYLYYGKADATDGADPEAAWDANTVMVQHMGDSTTSTITDSTSNGNNGTKKAANEPVEAVGQIGKAQSFDGTDDYISISPDTSIDSLSEFTVSGWYYRNNFSSSVVPFSKYYKWFFFNNDGSIEGDVNAVDTAARSRSSTVMNVSEWTYVVFTYTISDRKIRIFINGQEVAYTTQKPAVGALYADSGLPFLIGDYTTLTYPFDGLIDEVLVSNIARSAAWVKAEYNSGNGTLATMTQDWTVGTSEKRRSAGGTGPTPDGSLASPFDRKQVGMNYRGTPAGVVVGGSMTPTGAISKVIGLVHMGGSLTPTGQVNKGTWMAIGGSLTPTGALVAGAIFPVAVGGELDMTGDLSGGNPDWIEIHPWMNWKGEWAVGTEYALYDVVLYQDGLSIHAFVSKSSHNTGNLPMDSAHWDRLIQEKWRL